MEVRIKPHAQAFDTSLSLAEFHSDFTAHNGSTLVFAGAPQACIDRKHVSCLGFCPGIKRVFTSCCILTFDRYILVGQVVLFRFIIYTAVMLSGTSRQQDLPKDIISFKTYIVIARIYIIYIPHHSRLFFRAFLLTSSAHSAISDILLFYGLRTFER